VDLSREAKERKGKLWESMESEFEEKFNGMTEGRRN
jgi:hypothetical protein